MEVTNIDNHPRMSHAPIPDMNFISNQDNGNVPTTEKRTPEPSNKLDIPRRPTTEHIPDDSRINQSSSSAQIDDLGADDLEDDEVIVLEADNHDMMDNEMMQYFERQDG